MRLSVLLSVAALTGFAAPAFAESRSFELPSFDAVSVSAGLVATIDVGSAQSVSAEAPSASTLDRLDVRVEGGRLQLGISGNWMEWLFNLGHNRPIVVHVTVPALKAASASSGADMDVRGASGEAISIEASSGAAITATGISANSVSIDVSSGANAKLAGRCSSATVNSSSGARLNATELICDDVTANVSVGGSGQVHAAKAVIANTSTGGSLSVSGNPGVRTINSSTGGTVSFGG